MNNQYQCFGRDLTTDCARKLIQELFKGQTIRRREIVNAVFEQHHERGGMNSGVRPNIIQSSLKSMKESGLAANPEHGVWYITYYIKTLNEFTKWASQFDSREDSKQYLFRGVSSADYKIDASAYRRIKKGRDSEEEQDGDFEIFLQLNKNLISEARFRGHDRKNGRKLEDLEVLAEFQHYGAATFLMDFTYNALVSLWFACKKSSRNGAKDGKVVAIPPHDPRFTGVTTDFSVITLETLEKQIDQLSLDNKRLYQWQPRQQQNERIIAQQSIFLFGVLEIEINPDEECIIDGNSKEKIRESLKRIYGIAEDMLFPDFDGFARQYNQDEPYKELSATQYRQRANEAIQRGEYIKAIDDYSMAIHLNANYVEARYERGLANNNLGFTNNRQKQYEAARPYFDAAITDFDAVLN
ncbi:MAG: FRG domain-containing protein, partial [Candidatus Poribacteria bacterium]|nr:FRG domain-containing protein [Candidatus Poribacteria bacterium]